MTAGSVDLINILVVMLVGGIASFGGGMGPVAVIQGAWVTGGQLDPALFAWVLALSHLTPGPRAAFIAGVGYYLHGFAGSIVAMAGVLIPAWIAAAGAVTALERMRKLIDRLSRSGLYVVAGLMIAATIGTALPLGLSRVEIGAAGVAAWLVGRRGIDPVWIVCAALLIGLALQWI
jgi:chromate transporter